MFFIIFNNSFFLSNSGLFDFDMTFLSQALLFLILSLSVRNFFLLPISKGIEERNAYIRYNLQKIDIIIALTSEKVEDYVNLILEEKKELNRQNNLTKNYLKTKFEKEVEEIQKENQKLINKVKVNFLMQSLREFNSLNKNMTEIAKCFFQKKFL